MRYLITTLFFVGFLNWGLQAQDTLLFENFESGSLPASWDSSHAMGSQGWEFGTASALSSSYFDIPPHTLIAAANDDDCDCDASEDYLITPMMDFDTSSYVHLSLDAFYYDGSYDGNQEIATVEVSTDTGKTWTVVDQLGGSGEWQEEYRVDLSSYAGDTNLLIGFHYNDGGGWLYGWAIDNAAIYEPVDPNIALDSLQLPTYVKLGRTLNLTTIISNVGATMVDSLDLNWKATDGASATEHMTGLNLSPTALMTHTHSDAWTPADTGTYQVKIWADSIDGMEDQNHLDDTVQTTVTVVDTYYARTPLIEEFTNASCGPCASQNPGFQDVLESKIDDISVVVYRTYWPGEDTMYDYNSTEYDTRISYYSVSSVPTAINDGDLVVDDCGAYDGAPACLDSFDINESADDPAFINVKVTDSLNGLDAYIDVRIQSLNNYSGTDLRAHVAIVERDISFDTAPGTNGEKHFPWVMRKMLPDAGGTSLMNLTAGTDTTLSFQYTIDTARLDKDSLQVVAFMQNQGTQNIYNSHTIQLKEEPQDDTSAISQHGSMAQQIKMFPNPADESMQFQLRLDETQPVTVEIYNTMGEQVTSFHKGEMAAGHHQWSYATSSLESGVYFVQFQVGDRLHTEKLMIAR